MINNEKKSKMIEKHIEWLKGYKRDAFELFDDGISIIEKIKDEKYRKNEKIVDLFYEASEKFHKSSIKWDIFITQLFFLDKSYWPKVIENNSFQLFINKLVQTYYNSSFYYEKTADSIKELIKEGNLNEDQLKRFIFVLPQIYGKSVFKYKELFYLTFGRTDQKEDNYEKIKNSYDFEIYLNEKELNDKIEELYKNASSSWLSLIPIFRDQGKRTEEGITYGYVADCYLSIFVWFRRQGRVEKNYLETAISFYLKAEKYEADDQRRLIWIYADNEINELFSSISRESERVRHLNKLKESL